MAKNINGLSREFIIHPGEILKEILGDYEMSQKELALRTDVSEAHISSLINCQKDISVTFAKKLEYALGIDASFWINLQANYDKELIDLKEVNNISDEELKILKKLKDIVQYMQQIGIMDEETNDLQLVIKLRKLLNISSLIKITDISQIGAYRLAKSANIDPCVLTTWLKMCDLIEAGHKVDKELDVARLKESLPFIKELMFEDVSNIQTKLRTIFAECGIKFSIVKHFRGAPVQGVIKKKNDGSLSLIMTNRYKFADVFWFTLFHEIGHIINEDIVDQLIDYEFQENEAEEKASEFALNTLISPDKYEQFLKRKDFSLNHINQFCTAMGIPNFILIGRLQKEGYIEHSSYPAEKIKYEIEDLTLFHQS